MEKDIELLNEYKKLIKEIDDLDKDTEATKVAMADPLISYQDKREYENDLVANTISRARKKEKMEEIEKLLDELGIVFTKEKKEENPQK